MSSLIAPKLGFNSGGARDGATTGVVDEKLTVKIARTGIDAARRKFAPEFINRLDKIVTFQPLGSEQLRSILEIELNMFQQRIFNTSADRAFVFTVSEASKGFLLQAGTDLKYGARHLKRAIERLLVQPMSNLIATGQVRGGDWIHVNLDESIRGLRFSREAEGMPVHDMTQLADNSITIPPMRASSGAFSAPNRVAA